MVHVRFEDVGSAVEESSPDTVIEKCDEMRLWAYATFDFPFFVFPWEISPRLRNPLWSVPNPECGRILPLNSLKLFVWVSKHSSLQYSLNKFQIFKWGHSHSQRFHVLRWTILIDFCGVFSSWIFDEKECTPFCKRMSWGYHVESSFFRWKWTSLYIISIHFSSVILRPLCAPFLEI